MRFAYTDATTHVSRLNENRVAQGCLDSRINRVGVSSEVGAAHQQPGQQRQSGGGESRFHQTFIHAHGACGDTAAHVGQPRQFEQALDGAIFAHWAVEHREDDLNGGGSLEQGVGLEVGGPWLRSAEAGPEAGREARLVGGGDEGGVDTGAT